MCVVLQAGRLLELEVKPTSYNRLGRFTLAEKASQASMRRSAFRSLQTRCVAVAVRAMMGTSGNCCFSTPSFL